ncbi:hypothetical protein [Filobacillus milosensis]|nr:hypothetical protein [Filobacillus milosensis]
MNSTISNIVNKIVEIKKVSERTEIFERRLDKQKLHVRLERTAN